MIRCRKGASIAERLAFHSVVAPSGHWVWLGSLTNGYGVVEVDGHKRPAHRLAYELHVGPIPEGLHIDHLCRYTRCINPMHLQPVTPRINTLRGTSPAARAKRNGACLRGHSRAEFGRLTTVPGYGPYFACRECGRLRAQEIRARTGRRETVPCPGYDRHRFFKNGLHTPTCVRCDAPRWRKLTSQQLAAWESYCAGGAR
jgi:hypothetical protein